MKHEIFGISTDCDNNKFEDKFDCLYDGCGAFYESKETFHHDDETSFDYKFCVEVIDLDEACGDDKYGIELSLVPMFGSLNKKKQDSILSSCCIEENEVNTYDIHQYGCSVPLGFVEIDNEGVSYDKCKGVQSALAAIANVFESINGLRGFFLDKCVNGIGTTGWDLLNDYINGNDFVKATLERHKTE